MGILSVAEVLGFLEREHKMRGKDPRRVVLVQVPGDCRVVPARSGKGFARQTQPGLPVHRPGSPEHVEHVPVLGRPGEDDDIAKVLRRRPEERDPADIDLLEGGREIGPAGDRGLERIQRHRDEVDGADAVPRQLGHVRLVAPKRQEPPVDGRVQRLDPSTQDLG